MSVCICIISLIFLGLQKTHTLVFLFLITQHKYLFIKPIAILSQGYLQPFPSFTSEHKNA